METKGKIHKAPMRSKFGKVSIVLTDGNKGSLCCKDAFKDGNKWRALRKIKTKVFGSKEATVGAPGLEVRIYAE